MTVLPDLPQTGLQVDAVEQAAAVASSISIKLLGHMRCYTPDLATSATGLRSTGIVYLGI
ncbi:hypothetical protein ACU8KH_04892 [Lachancea thermotolerans]